MCNRDGSPCFQLSLKERHHTTSRPQYIAKSNGNKMGIGSSICILAENFSHAFCSTHDVGRIDCFVCGNQDELLHLISNGCLCDYLCTQYIVFTGSNYLIFQHGYMLIGGCMKNNIWLVQGK